MTHAETILSELNSRLNQVVDLTLYGRAAFFLGFEELPDQYSQSLDVDAVLWLGQAEELERTGNFWEALEETNDTLSPQGLYMSHLFVENQVILTADWRQNRAPIDRVWSKLNLFRLADEDLLLSKLMRDDPQDRQDAMFLVERRRWTALELEGIFQAARIPAIAEIVDEFESASAALLREIQRRGW